MCVWGADAAAAQRPAPEGGQPKPAPTERPEPPTTAAGLALPDIQITATVYPELLITGAQRSDELRHRLVSFQTAKSLRFEKVGNATVTFNPKAPTSVFIVEHNLPTPIEPNRTYTDVWLKLLITTSLVDVLTQRVP